MAATVIMAAGWTPGLCRRGGPANRAGFMGARPGPASPSHEVRDLFLKLWAKELKTTRKVLERIPEGSDYRPDPKSRTAKEIAWQIFCEERMIIDALESGKAEWAPPAEPATMKELLDAYEKQTAAI